ncbi:putative nuclease HARBI1 [Penaeus indicus]|uniref:putative nuclease HARBI1 n=1 Tax=Penaeus indicus TaxID=29960 RepID=UPI00300C085D
MDPFEATAESEFLSRFRMTKEVAHDHMQKILAHLPQTLNNRYFCTHYLQVRITLRYMAIGNHHLTVPDCYNVLQCYVSRCSSRVTRITARMSHNIIKMPRTNETLRVMGDFMAIAGIPAVVGCIDCIHITIKKPPGDRS